MYEQDYIMRLIREMARVVLKLLFHLELPSQTEEQQAWLKGRESTEKQKSMEEWKILRALVDEGRLDEAENRLSDLTGTETQEDLKLALMFYAYLNEKSTEFLENHGWTRDEVLEGIRGLWEEHQLPGVAELFYF